MPGGEVPRDEHNDRPGPDDGQRPGGPGRHRRRKDRRALPSLTRVSQVTQVIAHLAAGAAVLDKHDALTWAARAVAETISRLAS